MRFLLDTHAFLWMASDPERLGRSARDAVADPATPLLLSTASAWELAIKYGQGRLSLPLPVAEYVPDRLARSAIRTLAIATAHATAVAALPAHHKDPFDRLIVAQALAEDLTLISHDRLLEPYGVRLLWD